MIIDRRPTRTAVARGLSRNRFKTRNPITAMTTTRRQFIEHSGAALLGASALVSAAPRVLAAGKTDDLKSRPTLVVVYLRGGADALQVIVPYGDPLYPRIRPTLAIPGPQAGERGVAPLNNYFGLNPNLKPLYDLFKNGAVAPIVSVGSPHPTRSHFDAQDFMERAAPGIKSVTEGWLNRYLTQTRTKHDSELRGVSFQPVLPRSMRGEYPVLAVPGYGLNQTLDIFEKLYGSCDEAKQLHAREQASTGKPKAGHFTQTARPAEPAISVQSNYETIVTAGNRAIARLREIDRIVFQGSNDAKYPGSGFGQRLSQVARLIKADRGLEVTALDYGGWDHHAFEGGAQGKMANMLHDLSASLRAFVDDLGPRMDRTLVLVMSEFGRTAHENGNNGSDHGHGGFMLAIGNMVRGLKIHGRWTGLDRNNLYQRRDLPVHTDFRTVFAETLQNLFGYDPLTHNFFPGYQHRGKELGFLKQV